MTEQTIHYVKLHQCTFEQALYVRNRGFEEYFSDMTTSMPRLLQAFASNSISPEHSIVAFDRDQPIGFVFIAMKEVEGRLLAWNGGTGIIPEYRGKGLAKPLMYEMKKVMEQENVHTAWLEVVTKNTPAFSAYKSIGFAAKDEVVGLSTEDAIQEEVWQAEIGEPIAYTIEEVIPELVKTLPYYKKIAAWDCQWHVIQDKGGRALLIRDANNQVQGYAMYQVRKDQDGNLKSATLFQLEVAPDAPNAKTMIQLLLQTVFLPKQGAAKRHVTNFSSANPHALEMLKKAGFKEVYKQYVMKWSGQSV